MFQPSPFSKSTQDLSITTAILSKSSQRWQLIKPELIQGVSSHPHCLQVKSLLWKCNSLCKHPAITSNPYLLLCCRPRYFYCIGTLLCYVIILWPSLSFTDKGTSFFQLCNLTSRPCEPKTSSRDLELLTSPSFCSVQKFTTWCNGMIHDWRKTNDPSCPVQLF